MTYCQGKGKAVVTYFKASGIKETIVFDRVPINVKIARYSNNCWRFYGRGDDQVNYVLFASGNNPGYGVNFQLNSRGMTPMMNGSYIRGHDYYYVANYGVDRVAGTSEEIRILSGGVCTAGGLESCEITITDALGAIRKDVVLCNKNFTVQCDQECPQGQCKCPTTKYPGYCCIDCAEVGRRINNLAARI